MVLVYSFSNARASHGKAIVTLLVTANLHFARRKPGAPGPHAQFISVPKWLPDSELFGKESI